MGNPKHQWRPSPLPLVKKILSAAVWEKSLIEED